MRQIPKKSSWMIKTHIQQRAALMLSGYLLRARATLSLIEMEILAEMAGKPLFIVE